MEKDYLHNLTIKKKFLNRSSRQDIISSFKKVDINILLNRVKIDKINEKKRNFIYAISVLLGLSISAYIIFS
jgi:hypothetical protein